MEVVASSPERLACYFHDLIRFFMKRASRTMVLDSCVRCNKNTIINENYHLVLYHMFPDEQWITVLNVLL